MSDKQPIDYARAESADVVRNRRKRRSLLFVMVTLVGIVIGLAHAATLRREIWLLGGSRDYLPLSIASYQGRLIFYGKKNLPSNPTKPMPPSVLKSYNNSTIGFDMARTNLPDRPKWQFAIHYSRLLALTLILWIFALVFLIRGWKRKQET